DRPCDAAFEFKIAYELRLIPFDVGSRGVEIAGDLKQLLGRRRVQGEAQVGIAVRGERTPADQLRSRRREFQLIDVENAVDGVDLDVARDRYRLGRLVRFAVEVSRDAAVEAARVVADEAQIDFPTDFAGDRQLLVVRKRGEKRRRRFGLD